MNGFMLADAFLTSCNSTKKIGFYLYSWNVGAPILQELPSKRLFWSKYLTMDLVQFFKGCFNFTWSIFEYFVPITDRKELDAKFLRYSTFQQR